MVIVLLGPPGSGKGTQGKRISSEYDLHYAPFGDILRGHISKGTSLGKEVKGNISSGSLVSDDIICKILVSELERSKQRSGILFDGFPRNISQANLLDFHLAKHEKNISTVIFFDIAQNLAIERIKKRSDIEDRLDDQDMDKVADRFVVYRNETLPVRDFYHKKKKLNCIKADQDVDIIFNSLKEELDNIRGLRNSKR